MTEVLVTDALTKKRQYGQFFTPKTISRFMSKMFDQRNLTTCRLLDPGAGNGSLCSAFLELCTAGDFNFQRIEVDAFEIDDSLHIQLKESLEKYKRVLNLEYKIRGNDFIEASVEHINRNIFAEKLSKYTHIMLNPPYKKIKSDSAHRIALRKIGIETVNLYSAFVALSLMLLENHGQLVAIIPRSFCNGPYYKPFREYIFAHAAISHMHLFESRTEAFKDDDVLQENVIILLERGAKQSNVKITTSMDDTFNNLSIAQYPFNQIVFPDDPERFIRIPSASINIPCKNLDAIRYSLEDIGLMVSTGPVVDFRMKEYLRKMPECDTVPLLYPGHFTGLTLMWPKPDLKKPNAIQRNNVTEKWLYPKGFYCVVRRFSSKEEKRRVVASVVRENDFPIIDMVGFENHLNVFHENKKGMSEELAYGLAVFLNSTVVDDNFRSFNGHTQINATDLRLIKYPSRSNLIALGRMIMNSKEMNQALFDRQLQRITT